MTTAIQTQQSSLTPFEPSNLEQAMSLATTLSKSGLIPDTLRGKPSDILVVLMTGRELGIGPMQSLRGIAVVKGRAVMSADLMVAQCLRHRDVCLSFRLAESTDTRAVYETQRAGSEPVRLEWTIQQAQQAGLAGSNTWRSHPAAMLRARCSAALARAVYPDLVGGMYEESEGEEIAGKRAPAPVVSIAPPPVEAPTAEPVQAEPAPVEVKAEVVEPPPTEPLTAAAVWRECQALHGEHAKDTLADCRAKVGIPETTKTGDLHAVQLTELLEAIRAAGRIDF